KAIRYRAISSSSAHGQPGRLPLTLSTNALASIRQLAEIVSKPSASTSGRTLRETEPSGSREAPDGRALRSYPQPTTRGRASGHPATMAGVAEVEVVVAHHECATLRVGDVFLKIDSDQARSDVEVEAMALAPIPTPQVLWRKPPVLALAALPGKAIARLGQPSAASPGAWAAAGAAVRRLHD